MCVGDAPRRRQLLLVAGALISKREPSEMCVCVCAECLALAGVRVCFNDDRDAREGVCASGCGSGTGVYALELWKNSARVLSQVRRHIDVYGFARFCFGAFASSPRLTPPPLPPFWAPEREWVSSRVSPYVFNVGRPGRSAFSECMHYSPMLWCKNNSVNHMWCVC